MRERGAILLLSCYELGHQPLSLASPLATLSQAGYAPVAVDTSVEPLEDHVIAAAQVVAISSPMHTALRLGAQLAHRVRSLNPRAHVCFYGLYALLNADYLLGACADSVIGGEYEAPLLRLVQALAHRRPGPVPGVTTRTATPGASISRIPFAVPDRSSLPPLDRYARLESGGKTKLAGYVETTRGCLHTCRHCPITPVYAGRLFVVPANVVLEDIRAQVHMGARHITFGDPDFLNGPGHSMKVLRAMHAEFPDLTFDATIKIEHILEKRPLLAELKQLGCAFVLSAVESLSDIVLAHLDKGHTKADVVEALEIMQNAGIPLRPSLLPFTPWATLHDYLELLEFFETRGMIEHVDPVQFTIRLLVPPGSALMEDLSRDGLLGPLDAASYVYRWTHPDPRMDQLAGEVAGIVEAGEHAGHRAVDIFYQIKRRASAVAGRNQRAGLATAPYAAQVAPPRLTESWFC